MFFSATVYHNSNQKINIYGDDVEVDYRGYEVTAENFIRILTGRVKHGTPQVNIQNSFSNFLL